MSYEDPRRYHAIGRLVCTADDIALDYNLYEDCRMCEVVHLKGKHLTIDDVAVEDRWYCEVCSMDTMPGIVMCKPCRERFTR